MSNRSKIFFKGIADVSPLMIPVVPFGIIFGVLAIDLGLTPVTTIAMSIIIFGGASQIIFLQLVNHFYHSHKRQHDFQFALHLFSLCNP